jgi:hypothetical protein
MIRRSRVFWWRISCDARRARLFRYLLMVRPPKIPPAVETPVSRPRLRRLAVVQLASILPDKSGGYAYVYDCTIIFRKRRQRIV